MFPCPPMISGVGDACGPPHAIAPLATVTWQLTLWMVGGTTTLGARAGSPVHDARAKSARRIPNTAEPPPPVPPPPPIAEAKVSAVSLGSSRRVGRVQARRGAGTS